MRRQGVLRTPSQDVCIFCACRLAGRSVPPSSRASFATYYRQLQPTLIRRLNLSDLDSSGGSNDVPGPGQQEQEGRAPRTTDSTGQLPQRRSQRSQNNAQAQNGGRKSGFRWLKLESDTQGQSIAGQSRVDRVPATEQDRQAAKTQTRPQPVKKKSMPSFQSKGQEQVTSQSSDHGWGAGSALGAVEYGTKDSRSDPASDEVQPGAGSESGAVEYGLKDPVSDPASWKVPPDPRDSARTLQLNSEPEHPIAHTTSSDYGWGAGNGIGAVQYGTKDPMIEPALNIDPAGPGHSTNTLELNNDPEQSVAQTTEPYDNHQREAVDSGAQSLADTVLRSGHGQETASSDTIALQHDKKTNNRHIRFRSTQTSQDTPASQSAPEPSFGMSFASNTTPYEPPPAPYQPPEQPKVRSSSSNIRNAPGRNGRSQTSALGDFAKTGYRARVLDPQHSRAPAPARPRDNWPHFQKRNQPDPDMETDAASTIEEAPQQPKNVDIDKIFEQYRSTRDLKNKQRRPLATPSQADAKAESSPFLAQRCGLCGERGHGTRACPTAAQQRSNFKIRYDTMRGSDRPVHSQDAAQNGSAQQAYRPQPGASDSGPVRRKLQPPRTDAVSTYSPNVPSVETQDIKMKPSRQTAHTRAARFTDYRDDGVEPQQEDRLSSFEEAKQRMLKSSRFSNAPVKQERAPRRRAYDDDDDYHGRDDEDEIDTAVLEAREARKAEKQAKRDKARREREAAARNRDAAKAINLPDYISVSNLAQALDVHYDDFIDKLEQLGYDDVFPGKILNSETSAMIAMEYGFDPLLANEAESEAARDLHAQPTPEGADLEYLPARPPVVTIMGHVDHGKTTILDYLRKASVAAGEAGGITQHIGAFSVALEATGRTITFLDTPGHAAFLAMRQRGANVTDIVVLVVAADDSVKPQTLEALKHARAADVPIIVAINKVDKPEADVQRVKSDLGRHGIEIEDYGGDTQVIEVSGKTGRGMQDLEEAIVTQSEILDHRADTEGVVEGWVLEATTKPAGRVATVLVRRGTLKVGSILVAGKTWTRVRSLRNDNGHEVREASPGIPVEVDGWRDQPAAGDEVLQAESEQKATAVVDYRTELNERKKLAEDTEAINDARMLEQLKRDTDKGESPGAAEGSEQQSGPIKVPFVIKADVSGSAEAIEAYIMGVSSPLIIPQVLYSSVGQINENDIELASVAGGVIIAFNLPSDQGMKAEASARDVRVMEHNIIYRVLDEVKEIFSDKLPPLITQKVLGEAEISMPFEIGIGGRKTMKIAGCKVRNGVIAKSSRVRVMRDMIKIYDGSLSSLKNVKKDVQEMRKGSECGLAFDDWEGFEIGDLVQTYQEISEKRTL